MKRRAALYLFGTVFGVLALTLGIVQSDPFEAWVCERVEAEAGARLVAKVDIDHLQIRLLSLQPRIELYDIAVFPRDPAKPLAGEPSFQCATARVVFRPLQLWARRLDIDRVELEDPHLDLVQEGGRWAGLPRGLFIDEPSSSAPDALQLRLDAFLVKNGMLHLSAETADLQVGLTHIRALGTIEGNGSVVVDLAADGRRVMMKVGEDWFEEFVDRLSGQVVLGGKAVELRGMELETDSLSIRADGHIGLGGETDVQLSQLHAVAPLEFVERIDSNVPSMQGELDWTGSLSVTGDGFRSRGLAKVGDFRLDRFHFGEAEADLEITPERARARRVRFGGAGGKVEGPLELDWSGPQLMLSADLALAGASFARLLDVLGVDGSHVDATLGGKVAFSGPLSPLAIEGRAELRHEGLTWRDRPWNDPGAAKPNLKVPGGIVSGGYRVTDDGIAFLGVGATAGSSGLTLDGDLFFRGAADLRFAAAPLALGELSPIGGVPLSGTGPASGRIHGELENLVIEADLDLDVTRVADFDFGRGTGPFRFDTGTLTLSSTKTVFRRGSSRYEGSWKVELGEPPSLAFDVTIRDARVEDLADVVFGDVEASRYAQGSVSGHIRLAGPFDRLDGEFEAHGMDLVAAGERFATYRTNGRWREGVIWLDDLVATKPSGAQLYVRGNLGNAPDGDRDGLGGTVNVEAHTSKWTLSDLDSIETEGALTSELALRLHLGGRFYRPAPKGRLDLQGTRLYGQPLGASQIDFDTQPGSPGGPRDRLVVKGSLAGGSVKADARVHLLHPDRLPYSAVLELKRHSVKPYLMVLNPRIARDPEVRAIASGRLGFGGDVREIGGSTADIALDLLSLERGPHQIRNKEPVRIVLGPGGSVELRSVALAGEETDFRIQGGIAGGVTDIRAGGDVDLAFAELLTDVFSRVEGVLRVESFRVQGDPGRPRRYEGVAEIQGGTFKTRFFPIGPEDVTARIRVSTDEVKIESLVGKLGGGSVDGKGTILLEPGGGGVRSWQLGPFNLKDVNMRFPSYYFAGRVSGQLSYAGSATGPILGGDLTLEEARYTGPIEWKASTVAFRPVATLVEVASEDAKLFTLAVGMRADGDVWVRNDLGNIEFQTDPKDPLMLVGDNTAWGLRGSLRLVRGKIVFQGREFALTNADIRFDDPKQVDFRYDVTAETLLRDWQITIHAEGRRSRGQPQISTSANPPLSTEDINLLLLAGLTAQELKASGQDPGAVATIIGTTLGQGLGEQRGVTTRIKKALKLDAFDVVPSYTEGGSIGIKAVGRSTVNDDLSLSYSVGQSDRVTGSVQADYRLSRRIHIVGGWSNEQRRSTVSSEQEVLNEQGDVSLDARFRFEWK